MEYICPRCRTTLRLEERGQGLCRGCIRELWLRHRADRLREIPYPRVVAEDYSGRQN